MIEGLKRYPEYKAIGLPWLEYVPAHWRMVPNRALLRRRKVLVGDQHTRYQLLSLTKQGVIVRDISKAKGKFSSDMGTSQEVRPGDLIFCLFDVPETPRTVGLSPHHGMITGAYTVFESRDAKTAPFFELFYRAIDDRKMLGTLYSGLRNTIPRERLLGVKTPMPPAEEQGTIVSFLAHANRRIDRFVRTKRRLIALLNEQKQAIVDRLVLTGSDLVSCDRAACDGDLSRLPAGWTSIPTRYLFRQVTRKDIRGDEPKMSMSRRHGLVRSSVLHSNRAAQAATSVAMSVCHPGDLVVNKYQAHAGLFGAAIERGLVTANYSVFAPTKHAHTPYFALQYATSRYRGLFRIASRGVGDGMMPLYTTAFYCVRSIVPPIEEQRSLVQRVSDETVGFARAIATTETEINLVEQYRTRLITDVVTGQLDVREAAAHLPADDADGVSPSDESDDLGSDADEATFEPVA